MTPSSPDAATAPVDADAAIAAVEPLPPSRRVSGLIEDVRAGFAKRPRELSPKYFYDARGAELFERICALPEYYLTRSEAGLLDAHADALIDRVRPDHIVELGAGSARKTETLLAACERAGLDTAFWPLDVCASVLVEARERLQARFPGLRVRALAGDHTAGLDHLPPRTGRTLFVFLGSSLGNFEGESARTLLGDIAACMGGEDRLLLGVDPVKDRETLEAAYNDSEGVTAAFNANVLNVLNRELDGDIDVDAFRHRAVFNPAANRIEAYLDVVRRHTARLGALGETYTFVEGESLFTEISRKFTPTGLDGDLNPAGLAREVDFFADRNRYALHLVRRA
ncbi:L-histidine Nalpha-methyltransferase [Limimonas halophila]|uniref:L-histidine Nalpha-methyltransferase n=1 Tax=Limimonas halophila TaxID=1082479 RepID=A0A1G7TDI5_9PROT|nr:L-histidine N(alpha)-methyltransferase [Limimonas halophila]SDG32650.1 L-histidine Nalpha-methyltransferase [Limimonas halophila]